MAYEFKLPDLGEGLTEGEIARWLVQEGQTVAEDDPLVEIQTDKTTVEIPSPAAGTVSRILVQEGDVVPVGTVLVVIGSESEAEEEVVAEVVPRQPAPTPPAPTGGRARATPLVRRLAHELGVALEDVPATGPQGRVTEDDVRRSAAPSGPASEPAAREGRREPVRGVRRRIVEHLTRSHAEIPAVTFVEECDFSGLDLRQLLPVVLGAAASSLRAFPELNARLEGDELVYLEPRVQLGKGLQRARRRFEDQGA